MCGTIKRPIKGKARLQSQLKLRNMMAYLQPYVKSDTWLVRKNH